jgi:hypothetical protein
MQLQSDTQDLVDIGVKALNDIEIFSDLADAIANASEQQLRASLGSLKNYVINNSIQHRAVKLMVSMIEDELGETKGAELPEIDYHDFQSTISAHNNFNMDGQDGILGTYITKNLGKNGGYDPCDVTLSVFFYTSTPNYTAGKMTLTNNASGLVAKWEGTLKEFVNNGGLIRDRHDQSIVYPNGPFKMMGLKAQLDEYEKTVEVPKVPCTCGALYFGAKEYGPSHGSYCERYKK